MIDVYVVSMIGSVTGDSYSFSWKSDWSNRPLRASVTLHRKNNQTRKHMSTIINSNSTLSVNILYAKNIIYFPKLNVFTCIPGPIPQ